MSTTQVNTSADPKLWEKLVLHKACPECGGELEWVNVEEELGVNSGKDNPPYHGFLCLNRREEPPCTFAMLNSTDSAPEGPQPVVSTRLDSETVDVAG